MQAQRVWDPKEPLERCIALKETRSANIALLDYAQMGSNGAERSLRKLLDRWKLMQEQVQQNPDAALTQRPPTTSWGTLSTWSLRFAWVMRCEDWDAIQRTNLIRQQQEQQAAMLKKHTQIAQQMQKLALTRLGQLLEKDTATLLSPDDVRKWLQLAVSIERTSLGMPAEIMAITSMNDDELIARYRDLLARIGSAGSSDESEGADTP